MPKRIEVKVPDIGDYSNVPVIELLVAAGERVAFDDPLITLESEKATMDIPAPVDGVVAEFRVALGDEVSEGDVLLVIEERAGEDGEDAENGGAGESAPAAGGGGAAAREGDAPGAEAEGDAEAGAGAQAPRAGTGRPEADAAEPETRTGPQAKTGREAAPSGTAPGTAPGTGGGEGGPAAPPGDPHAPAPARRSSPTAGLPDLPDRRTAAFHATPSVRRFARELGVDLSAVAGSGRKGRILAEDVRGYVKQRLAGGGGGGSGAAAWGGLPPLPAVDFSKFGDTETAPLSRIKRLTAANLGRAWLHVPLVTHFDETDVTELDEFRRSLRDDPDARGARITLPAFAMKALAATLRAFPSFNASLAPDGEHLVLKRYFHIGMAVDTPEGLVVPVVRDVDRKRVAELALELAEVSERARARQLAPGDLQGACMTISSLGGIGGAGFTPIVNPPEVAILGLARTRVAPLWNGREFEPRTLLPVSLSYDHRVIDGAEAARFCRHLCLLLADVRRLLL